MSGEHIRKRSPRPGARPDRRANREDIRQPWRHQAAQGQGIRANGATHSQSAPGKLPSGGQIHQESEGARSGEVTRTTHRQPARPQKPYEHQTWQPPGKGPATQPGQAKTLFGRHETQPPRQQGATSGGGGQPRGQLNLDDRARRKAGERARREHRARLRRLNPHPATDSTRGQRQPSRGGHITDWPKDAGRRGRLTRTRRPPSPDRPSRAMQARHDAPVKPRRHRKEARSERGTRHGNPHKRPETGRPPGRWGPPAPPRGQAPVTCNYSAYCAINK